MFGASKRAGLWYNDDHCDPLILTVAMVLENYLKFLAGKGRRPVAPSPGSNTTYCQA